MELGADCYSHFKTLEFIVEGLLCGWRGERQRWRNHLLRRELPRNMEISTAQHHNNCHNVLTYINRYEW